jgi:hypothetical protein
LSKVAAAWRLASLITELSNQTMNASAAAATANARSAVPVFDIPNLRCNAQC